MWWILWKQILYVDYLYSSPPDGWVSSTWLACSQTGGHHSALTLDGDEVRSPCGS